jgi:hypothetical protein
VAVGPGLGVPVGPGFGVLLGAAFGVDVAGAGVLVTTIGVGDDVGVLVALDPKTFLWVAKNAAPRMMRISRISRSGRSQRGVLFGSSSIVVTVLMALD